MNVVIHQPHFFPWLGYFNKLAYADIFVFQDNVQFRRRYYQNRTKIRSCSSSCQWLTIPVTARRNTFINEVKTADTYSSNKVCRIIEQIYSNAKYFEKIWPSLKDSLNASDNSLLDINRRTLLCILELLDIDIIIEYASQYTLLPDPASSLVNICQELNADKYIFGEGGGLDYHGYVRFHKSGIKTYQQNFCREYYEIAAEHYSGCYNLSVLDFLFHVGIKETQRIVHKLGSLEVVGN